MNGFDKYYDEAVESGKRERAFAWVTAIGDFHRKTAANDGVNDGKGTRHGIQGTD